MFSIKIKKEKEKFFGNEKRFSSNYLNYVHFKVDGRRCGVSFGIKKKFIKIANCLEFWEGKMFD